MGSGCHRRCEGQTLLLLMALQIVEARERQMMRAPTDYQQWNMIDC